MAVEEVLVDLDLLDQVILVLVVVDIHFLLLLLPFYLECQLLGQMPLDQQVYMVAAEVEEEVDRLTQQIQHLVALVVVDMVELVHQATPLIFLVVRELIIPEVVEEEEVLVQERVILAETVVKELLLLDT
jgi:hypothetical protein